MSIKSNPQLPSQRWKECKWLLLIGAPVCAVMVFCLLLLVPQQYQSEFVIAKESEQAVEMQRAITLNCPQNYDLGLAKTDNAVNAAGYTKVVVSPQFLSLLLTEQVKTLDGSFEGTCYDYYLQRMHSSAICRWQMPRVEIVESANRNTPDVLTPEQVNVLKTLQKSIETICDLDTRFVTVQFRDQDPLVAWMMAKHVKNHLLKYVGDYERAKMQNILDQLNEQIDRVTDNPELANALRRQAVVYKAQMMTHPAFVTLSEPIIDYEVVAPHRIRITFVVTLLYILIVLGWTYRRELRTYLDR